MPTLTAGAAEVDFTPRESHFLYGYPHVPRMSTGVHDPLLSCALYLSDGTTRQIFIANDIIFANKSITARVRERVEEETGVPATNILISATHTHSGPQVDDQLAKAADPVVPPYDPAFVNDLVDAMVRSAVQAAKRAEPAQLGLAIATVSGVGSNRHDPNGPTDAQVPVMVIRSADGKRNLAAQVVYGMHPTVLHEDSTLYSGDFPAFARQYLRDHTLGKDCVVLYHLGAAGDQSPRHVTRANTFEEAIRLGHLMGEQLAKVIPSIQYRSDVTLSSDRKLLSDLLQRKFRSVADAERERAEAHQRLEHLRATGAPRTAVRTAECDWFGAEETVTFAKAAESGQLADVTASCLPVEIQRLDVGPWTFVAWPGELFVEFALAVKRKAPNTFVITCANGHTSGYIVTQQAIDGKYYEATNAVFQSPDTGDRIVHETLKMLEK